MMKQEHIEAMSDILSEQGIYATEVQIKQIAQDFFNHLEMDREMEGHGHGHDHQTGRTYFRTTNNLI